MSRLSFHEKSDRRKWAAVTIAILVIVAVIVSGICTDWYTEKNKFCLFGHDYDEAGKCIRCGKDKPIENEDDTQAFISERFVFASARQLAASNGGISAQSTMPGRPLAVGDKFENIDTIYADLSGMTVSSSINCKKLFVTNDAEFYVSVVSYAGSVQYTLSTCDISSYTYSNVSNAPTEIFWGDLPSSKIISLSCSDLEHYKYDYGNTITELGTLNVNVSLVSTSLPAAPTKTGYTFTGWYTDEACTNKYTAPTVTADITLYAGFRAHTYSIKFNVNSGSGTMANESMTYDQNKALTSNTFTKEHYAFKGWATSANGNVAYTNGQSVKNLSATDGAVIELFAIWERSEVSVTFSADGSSNTVWIGIGTAATLPDNPVKEGHTFAGWYLADGTKYTNQTLTEDTTLTARFEIIRCTVTFIVDGEVYATYVCDWGTSLSEALNANDVNPALLTTEDEYSPNF